MSSKNLQKNAVYLGLVFISLVGSYQYFHSVQLKYLSISSFRECVDVGYGARTTNLEKCVVYGKTFINPLFQNKIIPVSSSTVAEVASYKNQRYIIEGEQVQLYNGKGELSPNQILKEGSSTLLVTGDPYLYDMNGDGLNDAIFMLQSSSSKKDKKSYYLTASMSLNDGYSGINGLFLDYSVLGAAYVYKNGELVVGYTTNDASTTIKQKYFIIENDILKQVSHK